MWFKQHDADAINIVLLCTVLQLGESTFLVNCSQWTALAGRSNMLLLWTS